VCLYDPAPQLKSNQKLALLHKNILGLLFQGDAKAMVMPQSKAKYPSLMLKLWISNPGGYPNF
jgi:hypothetical protein